MRQRVRADRRDDERRQFLTQNRPSRRQTVRGGANRRTQDQAIAAVTGHRFIADDEVDVDHVEGRSGLQGDLVEAEIRLLDSGSLDPALVHEVMGDVILAAQHLEKTLAQLFGV